MAFIPNFDDELAIKVAKTEIEIVDVFSLNDLYLKMHDWLTYFGFKDVQDDNGNFETRYWEKTYLDGAKDIRIWWRVYKKINDFFTYFMKIDMRGVRMQKKEVNFKGTRIKADQGNFVVIIEAWLFVDPEKKFRNNSLIKLFWPFFYRFQYKKQIDMHEDMLLDIFNNFKERIKRFLELNTIKKVDVKPFHPPRGLK